MYTMYVDESGDTGLTGSPSRYFALSGIIVHESNWRALVNQLMTFKKRMKSTYNFPVRAEIHAADLLRKNPYNIAKHNRLAIIRNFADELASMPFVSLTNIVVDKFGKPVNYDVFEWAWKTLFQRFENTLSYGNFSGGHKNDFGIIFTDNTDGRKLTQLLRRMCVFNYVPSYGGPRNLQIVRVIEDPHGKDSAQSLPIQACDVCAYLLHQHLSPNSYVRRKGAQNYFARLAPILNRKASRANGYGIVIL